MTKKTRTQLKHEAEKEGKKALRAEEREAATRRYRMCINHQTLEMLSTLSTISATETVKVLSNVEYRIGSVDGNTHPVWWQIYQFSVNTPYHYHFHIAAAKALPPSRLPE